MHGRCRHWAAKGAVFKITDASCSATYIRAIRSEVKKEAGNYFGFGMAAQLRNGFG
jgi:hypothetical protein